MMYTKAPYFQAQPCLLPDGKKLYCRTKVGVEPSVSRARASLSPDWFQSKTSLAGVCTLDDAFWDHRAGAGEWMRRGEARRDQACLSKGGPENQGTTTKPAASTGVAGGATLEAGGANDGVGLSLRQTLFVADAAVP